MESTSLGNGDPSPLTSGRIDSIVLPVAYLESSNPAEKEWDKPGVVPERVKSLERRTEGWRVELRDTVESDGSQEDSDGSEATAMPDGYVLRGGVSLNTEGSPEAEDDPDNKSPSPSLSLSSNPTPGETGLVSQLDRGCEG